MCHWTFVTLRFFCIFYIFPYSQFFVISFRVCWWLHNDYCTLLFVCLFFFCYFNSNSIATIKDDERYCNLKEWWMNLAQCRVIFVYCLNIRCHTTDDEYKLSLTYVNLSNYILRSLKSRYNPWYLGVLNQNYCNKNQL